MIARWIAEDSPFRFALLAVLVGFVAGLGAVVFRGLIALFHNLFFFGQFSLVYSANAHTPASPWGFWVILVPVVGAILVAFLVKNFAPEAKGHGVPEVMDAIYYQRGVIRPVVALVKSLASSLSIGSGGSVGREGPIIQIGSAFGSTLGQLIRMPEWQRLTLVACGAGGGIAATFNTPIGGMLFAIELILPEVSARTLVPVAIATGGATFVGRTVFGDHPSFDIPALAIPVAHAIPPLAYLAYIALGVMLGLVSVVYIRALYGFEDLFNRMPGNYYTRHVGGMLLVGVMMYLSARHLGHYYVEGIGYSTVQDTLTGALTDPTLMVVLFGMKLLATSITLGSGASGGVFSPSLFMGAVLGAAYAVLVSRIAPGLHLDGPGTAIIGMACVVGAATGAVLTAVVMIFEMTRDYNVIIPVIVAVAFAYGVRSLLLSDNIYTLKLTRRGHYIPASMQTHLYMLRTAIDFINVPLLRVPADADLSVLYRRVVPVRPVPHVLVTDGNEVHAVLPAPLARLQLRQRAGAGATAVGSLRGSPYVVMKAEDQIFDIVATMRAQNRDVAVITRAGVLESVNDVVGVVTWADIMEHGNLPREMLVRKRIEGAIAGDQRQRK
ncbi:MAG TPA: chloride channel protein [Gammaproteobacteria bacterium]|nr:chloride channel protein [Gammaproteobacteria bacterium]